MYATFVTYEITSESSPDYFEVLSFFTKFKALQKSSVLYHNSMVTSPMLKQAEKKLYFKKNFFCSFSFISKTNAQVSVKSQ